MNVAPQIGVLFRIKRVALTCAMVVLTLNVWTGGPLLALWIGSQVQGDGPPSMSAVGLAAVSLGVISYVLVRLLARVDAAHSRMTGRPSTVKRSVPWLRSMRGERPHDEHHHVGELSSLEIILVVSVVLVFVLFEIWFFFYSGSPFDQRTGRDHEPPLIGLLLSGTL
jgi:hypothetical protein